MVINHFSGMIATYRRITLLITFFSSLNIILAQNNIDIKVGNTSVYEILAEQRDREGVYYLGNGQYEIVEVGSSFNTNLIEMERDARLKAKELVTAIGASLYKDLYIDKVGGAFSQLSLKIVMVDAEGNPIAQPEEAKGLAIEKLKELKNLNDLGILSEEEFRESAAPLKKIILESN